MCVDVFTTKWTQKTDGEPRQADVTERGAAQEDEPWRKSVTQRVSPASRSDPMQREHLSHGNPSL